MDAFEGLVGELEYPMFIVTARAADGEPLGCLVGGVVSRLDAGDHDAFLLEPLAGSSTEQDEFTFHRAKRIDPGHEA